MTPSLPTYLVRDRSATGASTGGRFLVTLPGADVLAFEAEDADALAGAWERLATPVELTRLEGLLGARWPAIEGPLRAMMAAGMVRSGALEALTPGRGVAARGAGSERACGRLLVAVTGSSQAIFVAQVLHRLQTRFTEELDVVLTRTAQRFVRPEALAVLGAHVWVAPVPDEALESGRRGLAETEMVLVLPATADAIARLAHGTAEDRVVHVALGDETPLVVAPSMNHRMWSHPAVRENVSRLRRGGAYVIEPGPSPPHLSEPGLDGAVGAVGAGFLSPNWVQLLESILQDARRRAVPSTDV